MTFGSLFAGIGGFDLGLERAGMTCSWQVEIDPYARRVLAKHWPHVRRWDDVRTFPPPDGYGGIDLSYRVDLICGGFPCQDISNAGRRAGIDGERSGLWGEFARIIGELRPRYVLLENVASLLVRGMDRVLGDLSSLGYDAEWEVIPACAVGAPHVRERVWILAYAHDQAESGMPLDAEPWEGMSQDASPAVSDSIRQGLEKRPCFGIYAREELAAFERSHRTRDGHWSVEPDVGRVAHGVPARMDRLRCLGNAVVPQVVEWIGRAILSRGE